MGELRLPKIRPVNLPRPLWEHILERVAERAIILDDLQRLRSWVVPNERQRHVVNAGDLRRRPKGKITVLRYLSFQAPLRFSRACIPTGLTEGTAQPDDITVLVLEYGG